MHAQTFLHLHLHVDDSTKFAHVRPLFSEGFRDARRNRRPPGGDGCQAPMTSVRRPGRGSANLVLSQDKRHTRTQRATVPPTTVVLSGPRMLNVRLVSHPTGVVCTQPGLRVELRFGWDSADALYVRVQEPHGGTLLKDASDGLVDTWVTCAQMPSLFRFYPVAADGTEGPPWNFNV